MDLSGKRFGAERASEAIANMHERSNGLGGGFAVYGIYPDSGDELCSNTVMYLNQESKEKSEAIINNKLRRSTLWEIPVDYFSSGYSPSCLCGDTLFIRSRVSSLILKQDDFVVEQVMRLIWRQVAPTSSQAVRTWRLQGRGFSRGCAEFFRLNDYEGYMWICHGRFPTNTPGWWGRWLHAMSTY